MTGIYMAICPCLRFTSLSDESLPDSPGTCCRERPVRPLSRKAGVLVASKSRCAAPQGAGEGCLPALCRNPLIT